MVGSKGISPEQIAASGTEHGHQCAIFQWIALTGRNTWPVLKLLFAVPNGGDRKMSVAAAMKAEGVKPGVPDLVLPVPAGRFAGLFIEMKKPGEQRKKDGGRSEKQVEWHGELLKQHYAVATCYSWRAAVWTLQMYLMGSLAMPEGGDALPVDEMYMTGQGWVESEWLTGWGGKG